MSNLSQAQLKQRRLAGKARAKQFTREYQQMARSHLPHEAVVRGAKAGYAATFRTGKLGILQAKLSERNRQNASCHHKQVKAKLLEWGLAFSECQFPFEDAMHEVDFMLSKKRVIEVDGYRFKDAPFGNTARDYRGEFEKKSIRLEQDGYQIFVFDSRYSAHEFERLSIWLQCDLNKSTSHDELPF